jgi:hypothetical protein
MSLQRTVRTRTSENRGKNEFKRGYQPRSNLVKDENGDLLADSKNIFSKHKNYFAQLVNMHRVGEYRQSDINTAETPVPSSSLLEVEIAIVKLEM